MTRQPSQRVEPLSRQQQSFALVMLVALALLTIPLAPSNAQVTVQPIEPVTATPLDGRLDALVNPNDAAAGIVVTDAGTPLPRRQDGGGTIAPTGVNKLPDLVQFTYGYWHPFFASNGSTLGPPSDLDDPYDGQWESGGEFLRINLVFDGLINPAGPIDGEYTPHQYGQSPVYGFVELDIDGDIDTGGETLQPVFRYLANVGRFGGLPRGALYADRVAFDGIPIDADPGTSPMIDRSGEDLHLYLGGGEQDIVGIYDVENDVTLCNGATDCQSNAAIGTFAAGDTWDVFGRFVSLAHGYEPFLPGTIYAPVVRLRFRHLANVDLTMVSLVFPLTNAAWADATGVRDETPALNFQPDDGHSLQEALFVLQQGAAQNINAADPYRLLIDAWSCDYGFDTTACRAQSAAFVGALPTWRPTVLISTVLASAPLSTTAGVFVPTSVFPAPKPGDFNGDGFATRTDAALLADFVSQTDGTADDAGPGGDLAVEIVDFGPNFSMYDVNYDGFVDADDYARVDQMYGDFDNDSDIDLFDVVRLQQCQSTAALNPGALRNTACLDAFDINHDQKIDANDLDAIDFSAAGMSGPD